MLRQRIPNHTWPKAQMCVMKTTRCLLFVMCWNKERLTSKNIPWHENLKTMCSLQVFRLNSLLVILFIFNQHQLPRKGQNCHDGFFPKSENHSQHVVESRSHNHTVIPLWITWFWFVFWFENFSRNLTNTQKNHFKLNPENIPLYKFSIKLNP